MVDDVRANLLTLQEWRVVPRVGQVRPLIESHLFVFDLRVVWCQRAVIRHARHLHCMVMVEVIGIKEVEPKVGKHDDLVEGSIQFFLGHTSHGRLIPLRAEDVHGFTRVDHITESLQVLPVEVGFTASLELKGCFRGNTILMRVRTVKLAVDRLHIIEVLNVCRLVIACLQEDSANVGVEVVCNCVVSGVDQAVDLHLVMCDVENCVLFVSWVCYQSSLLTFGESELDSMCQNRNANVVGQQYGCDD